MISVNHLSENQARAFLIAENRLTENSVWDDGLLAQHLKVFEAGALTPASRRPASTWVRSTCGFEGLAAETDDDDSC